ncbi:MAG: VOC family protein [Thermoproteota archaeon]|nr:VOC family protein [Candidatus Brockarchaeota archaeon]MBO3768560.1 VOC family protein [Candidatus Brockarchaeota archaeon]MBO3801958.1 VOC family protein [Candidatus Brockarchaeota archaeon]
MSRAVRFDHVSILTKDLEESVKFYTQILRFPIIRTIESKNLKIVFVDAGNATIELFGLVGDQAKPIEEKWENVGIKHIALEVDDVENFYNELKSKGVRFESEPTVALGGPKIAFFKDPNGVTIELIQWKVYEPKIIWTK